MKTLALDCEGKKTVSYFMWQVGARPKQCLVSVPSPPMSPAHGTDEASHFGSILESVCDTKHINSAAITKLCEHVKADPQEQQV